MADTAVGDGPAYWRCGNTSNDTRATLALLKETAARARKMWRSFRRYSRGRLKQYWKAIPSGMTPSCQRLDWFARTGGRRRARASIHGARGGSTPPKMVAVRFCRAQDSPSVECETFFPRGSRPRSRKASSHFENRHGVLVLLVFFGHHYIPRSYCDR